MKKVIPLMAAVLFAGLATSARADLIPTTGLDYNVIAFGDYTQSAVDVTGRLAVQGNLTASSFAVGDALTSSGGTSLVVGGNLDWTNGTVYAGDTRVGGTASIQGFGSGQGSVFYYNAPGANPPPSWVNPVQTANGGIAANFFTSAYAYASLLSANLGAMTATATTTAGADGHLYLTGTSASLNVFHVTAAQLAASSWKGIDISAPAGSTVVVDVNGAGGSVSVGNLGITLSGGVTKQDIVYNFTDTTQLDTTNIGWLGSILAPGAAFLGDAGNVDGDVAVASVGGSTEFHDFAFDGTLPSSQMASPLVIAGGTQLPAPEPSTMLVLMSGLASFPLLRRRTRRVS